MSQKDILQSIHSIPQSENQISFMDLTCKLDRILRLYRMVKSVDTTMMNQVNQRANQIMKKMEEVDGDKFRKCQDKIKNFIAQQLAQPSKKKQQPKAPSSNSSLAKKSGEVSNSSSPFGSSSNLKSNQKVQSQPSGVKNLDKNKSSQIQKSPLLPPPKQSDPNKFPLQFNKKQQQAQLSGGINSNSQRSKLSSNLKQYCQVNGAKIQQKLVINEQIYAFFKQQNPDKVILLGVQKPHDNIKQKLYLCTYMQCPKQQVTSMKFKAKDYQNQLDQFLNVIRYPLALGVIGQKITDMKLHYIKFLLEMTSPLPLVIIFNQTAPDKSLIIRMNDPMITEIQNTNIIQIDRLDKERGMKDKSRYKCLNFKDILVAKDKCITTKLLTRKLHKQIIENDQAIMVEKTAKPEVKQQVNNQQLIKQEGGGSGGASGDFQYKVHTKFISSTPQDFFVYLISDQKQLNNRKKFKTFNQIMDFVKNTDRPCAIGYTMKTVDKKIPSQLFTTCLKLGDKCPIIVLRLKNLSLNKVAFLSLKPGITQQQLNANPVSFKEIQGNQSVYLNVLLIGHKGNMNNYQGKNALQQI